MRTEDRNGVRGHFRKLFNETGATRLQRIDDPFVVHDFVPHVDRRPVFVERALDNLNRTYDACAETARRRQNNLHHAPPSSAYWPPAACAARDPAGLRSRMAAIPARASLRRRRILSRRFHSRQG